MGPEEEEAVVLMVCLLFQVGLSAGHRRSEAGAVLPGHGLGTHKGATRLDSRGRALDRRHLQL